METVIIISSYLLKEKKNTQWTRSQSDAPIITKRLDDYLRDKGILLHAIRIFYASDRCEVLVVVSV